MEPLRFYPARMKQLLSLMMIALLLLAHAGASLHTPHANAGIHHSDSHDGNDSHSNHEAPADKACSWCEFWLAGHASDVAVPILVPALLLLVATTAVYFTYLRITGSIYRTDSARAPPVFA